MKTNPRPCRFCGQMMSRDLLEQRNKEKGRKVSAALRDSWASGEHAKRKRAYDPEKLKEAYLKYGSFRKAAAALGISAYPIYRAIKESK